jgi:hypothetical protein
VAGEEMMGILGSPRGFCVVLTVIIAKGEA